MCTVVCIDKTRNTIPDKIMEKLPNSRNLAILCQIISFYKMATEIAAKLVRHGYGVITGGGPGIMEAGNKGAHSEGGKSVGLNIDLPFEQFNNKYIDHDKLINFKYFFRFVFPKAYRISMDSIGVF